MARCISLTFSVLLQVSGATGIIPEADITPASGLPELEKLQSSIKVNTDLLKVRTLLEIKLRK